MRYVDKGNLHKDFHILLYRTIKYLEDNYGNDFIRDVFFRTAQKVYKEIYEELKNGDYNPLLEFWDYYLKREGGKFKVRKEEDKVILEIDECPSVKYLKEKGIELDESFCLQDVFMNDAWSENTPFQITTEIIKIGKCRHVIERKK